MTKADASEEPQRWCVPSEVSVVIPCFRCANTIERAVESVLRQTALPREIVLVDDCSPDSTREVIDRRLTEWNRQCPTRLVKRDRNGGPARARSIGMDQATGDWVAFLDADDFWLPPKLEVQCRVTSDHRASFATHLTYWAGDEVEPVRRDVVPEVRWLHYSSQYWRNRTPTPTVLLRRTGLRFESELSYCEDHDFWLRYLKESLEPILQIRERLCVCNVATHDGGLGGQLWPMYRGQLSNLVRHRPGGVSGLSLCIVAVLLSSPAFIRRAARKALRSGRRRRIDPAG